MKESFSVSDNILSSESGSNSTDNVSFIRVVLFSAITGFVKCISLGGVYSAV